MSRVASFSLWLLCLPYCIHASAPSNSLQGVQEHPGPWNADLVFPHKDYIEQQPTFKSGDPEDESDVILDGVAAHQNSSDPSTPRGERILSRFVNAARYAISFPQKCEYGNKTHQCKFGLSCYVQGDNSVDLCGGGRIWTCCVPSEEIADQNLIANAECGRTYMGESKIVGGWPTNFGEHPWQVGILRRAFPFMSLIIFCGGSLISDRFVLTAAHCVDGRLAFLLKARLGYHSVDEVAEYPYEDFRVSRIFVHESYERLRYINDIALLELAKTVRFKKHIVPICLPEIGARFVGETATVSGFGHEEWESVSMSSSLREVNIPVIDNQVCTDWISSHQSGIEIQDTMLCAGFAEGGKDSCQGDSGGPLFLRKNRRAELIGIVSWGYKCGLPQAPGVYTSVSDYLDWINNKTKVAQSDVRDTDPREAALNRLPQTQ